MRTASLLVALLRAATTTARFGVQKANAPSSPVNFNIIANVEAWNATVFECTSGTRPCNPTITEFSGVISTATVK